MGCVLSQELPGSCAATQVLLASPSQRQSAARGSQRQLLSDHGLPQMELQQTEQQAEHLTPLRVTEQQNGQVQQTEQLVPLPQTEYQGLTPMKGIFLQQTEPQGPSPSPKDPSGSELADRGVLDPAANTNSCAAVRVEVEERESCLAALSESLREVAAHENVCTPSEGSHQQQPQQGEQREEIIKLQQEEQEEQQQQPQQGEQGEERIALQQQEQEQQQHGEQGEEMIRLRQQEQQGAEASGQQGKQQLLPEVRASSGQQGKWEGQAGQVQLQSGLGLVGIELPESLADSLPQPSAQQSMADHPFLRQFLDFQECECPALS